MSSAAIASEARDQLPRSAGLRGRLRAATAKDHERLDSKMAALDLQSAEGYRKFLEVNAAALLPIEDALEASRVTDSFPDWPKRSRRNAMLHDLVAIGAAAKPLAPVAQLDTAGVIGTMYVLEGSRLGARYLMRTVTRSPDPTVRGATAYLGHGEGQRLWQSFLERLESFDLSPDDETRAVDAARSAFAMFERAVTVTA